MFADLDNTKLTAQLKAGTKETQALFLHLHNATGDLSGKNKNATGDRAEVVKVEISNKKIRNHHAGHMKCQCRAGMPVGGLNSPRMRRGRIRGGVISAAEPAAPFVCRRGRYPEAAAHP